MRLTILQTWVACVPHNGNIVWPLHCAVSRKTSKLECIPLHDITTSLSLPERASTCVALMCAFTASVEQRCKLAEILMPVSVQDTGLRRRFQEGALARRTAHAYPIATAGRAATQDHHVGQRYEDSCHLPWAETCAQMRCDTPYMKLLLRRDTSTQGLA